VVTQLDGLKNLIKAHHFSNNSPTVDQQSTGTYDIDSSLMISDCSINYLSQMKEAEKGKDDFLTLLQLETKQDPKRIPILREFQESYSPDQVLTWFNRDPMFGKVINTAFQSTNIEKMYHYRLLLRDIRKQFEQYKCPTSVRVYRGQLMSDENLEQLKNFKGKMIAIKSFFSTNIDREMAMSHIRDLGTKKRILFDIDADPKTEGAKPFIKCDTLPNHNDKHEVIFMVGSLFKINDINEETGVTVVKMVLCANEIDNPFKDYLNDTKQEKDLIGYAQLQCNMSRYFSYPGILENVDKLLEEHSKKLPENHLDRIRCYDTLGNITFAKSNLDSSLSYYEKSLEMKKKQLQSNDPGFIDAYNNIGFVHLHKGNDEKALDAFKEMLKHSKQVYGDDHLYLISCYTNLIGIYESGGKFTEVLSCYFQICSIMLKHMPVDDVNFAPIYNNIGKTFVSLGQYPLALGYYETSLNIKLAKFDPSSESIALTYKAVGIVYQHLGKTDQAKINFDKAVEIYRKIYSPTHESVLEIEKLIQNLSSTSK